MDQKQLFKQMLDFQKATFDNSFKAMATLQEQGEKMVDTFLQQATWLPEEGKKAVNNWINAYREGREKYREAVEQNFEKVEAYFAGTDKSAE
jgi:polyhydroxyalkanoate synthesis regulator phasin